MTCATCGAEVTPGTVCVQCGATAGGQGTGWGGPPAGPPPPIPGMQPPPAAPPSPYAGATSYSAPGSYGGPVQPDPGSYGHAPGTPHTYYGYSSPQIPTPSGLSLPAAVKRVLSHYATFAGRASRSEFWWWTLAQALAVLVPVIIVAVITSGSSTSSGAEALQGLAGLWVLAVVLGTVVPTIAVTVRRLHDAGQSGWLYLLIFIPTLGGIVLLVLCALGSQPVANQYGLAPTGQRPPFQLQ